MTHAPSKPTKVATWSELEDRAPAYALVANVDLVVTRFDDRVSVLYGRCLHRGALMSDGTVQGEDIVCGLHGWDYRLETGVSAYDNAEVLHRFEAWIDAEKDAVMVDEAEVEAWHEDHPQAYDRDAYLGLYEDHEGASEEPYNKRTRRLAVQGPEKTGHHGAVSSMGVPLTELPRWDSIQLLTAQLHRKPKLDDDAVGTEVAFQETAEHALAVV